MTAALFLEDLLKSAEEDVDNVPPSKDAAQYVFDEVWRMDRMAWFGEEQQ